MPVYILKSKTVISADLAYLLKDYLGRVVLENNKTFTTWNDPETNDILVRCDNQPRDIPIFGLKWEEKH